MPLSLNRRDALKGVLGAGAVLGTGAALASLPTSSAEAATPALSMPATVSVDQPANRDLLFASNFNGTGFAEYKNFHPTTMVTGRDVGLQKDPTGSGKVAWLDSHRRLTAPGNPHPRASLEAPVRFYAAAHGNTAATYAHAVRLWIPSDSHFSTRADWCAFMGIHGSPWTTGSSSGLMMVYNPATGNHYFRMGEGTARVKSQGYPFPEKDAILPLNTWIDVIQYVNYNYAAHGGWMRLFIAYRGSGFREIPLWGHTGGVSMDVITDGEGSGWFHNQKVAAATARTGIYGNRPMRMLIGYQRISRTLAPVINGRTVNGAPLSKLKGFK